MFARRIVTSLAVPALRVMPKITYTSTLSMSFTKVGMAVPVKAAPKAKVAPVEKTARGSRPLLSAVLRKLYVLIHPDFFEMYPEQQETNTQSLMTLQGFLSGLKNASVTEKITHVKNEKLYFYLRGDQPGHFRKAELILHYTGGSKDIVYNMLNKFFIQLGIADGFKWDIEYWPRKLITAEDKADFKARANAEKNDKYRESYDEDGKFNNSNESYEEFQERLKFESSKM